MTIRRGTGHAIGVTVTPAGSVHVIVGAWPESPGERQ